LRLLLSRFGVSATFRKEAPPVNVFKECWATVENISTTSLSLIKTIYSADTDLWHRAR
jgi:hypothetical protein